MQMNTPLLNWHESKYARLCNKKQGGLMCGKEKNKAGNSAGEKYSKRYRHIYDCL